MEDSNRKDASGQEVAEREDTGKAADSTSKETLEDLEESEKISDSASDVDEDSVPSPDGIPDSDAGGRSTGTDAGGPM